MYGGTKTEMERLVSDASKLTDIQKELGIVVDGNSMSFGNIINAISVIQKNMGIAGTTTKEAGETITGSMNAMNGAWKNLITGIADDNANFSQLIDDFINSVVGENGEGGMLSNIIPRIEIIINGIVKLVLSLSKKIINYLPSFLQTGMTILQTLLNGIISMIPQLIPILSDIINTFITFIIDNLPMILNSGIQLLLSLINGITQSLPTLIPVIIDAVLLIVNTLLDNIDLIIDSGIELILALTDGLIEALPILIEKAPVIIEKLVEAIIRNFPKIVSAGGELIGKLISGLVGSFWKLLEVAPQLISTIVNGIKKGHAEIKNTGKYLVEGIWNGISEKANWMYDKIKSFANNIVGNVKKALGIHSPSKVFEEQVGKNMALGIGQGFENTMEDVTKIIDNSIPTNFDSKINVSPTSMKDDLNVDFMFETFKNALKEVKVVMNDREMGTFVTDTMEKVVYL